MLEQVEAKLKEFKQQQKVEYEKRKKRDLSDWGLAPGRKKPLIVTDEEYAALIEASASTQNCAVNKTSRLLNMSCGFVVALGLVTGVGLSLFVDGPGFIYFSVSVVISSLLAVLFRGLAEAVRLLQQLIDLRYIDIAKKNAREAENKEFPDIQPNVDPSFNETGSQHFSTTVVQESVFD